MTGFGTWLAKFRDATTGKRIQEALGTADDVLDANGATILNWKQANVMARQFFERVSKAPVQAASEPSRQLSRSISPTAN